MPDLERESLGTAGHERSAWAPEIHPVRRLRRTVALAVTVGVLAGLAAFALHTSLAHGAALLIGRFADLGGPAVGRFRWELLVLPALGGLGSGILVHVIFRLKTGQGTNQLVNAFHQHDGVLSFTGSAVKAVASVGVISCGGSAGPEGPIAALGAGLGSSVGRIFHVTPRERRVLLVAGCAAGIGAIFNCPLGGALFAASVLYRRPEFEGSSLVPAFVASAAGYATFLSFVGFGSHLFAEASSLRFTSISELPAFLLLGLLSGGVSIFFSIAMHTAESTSERARSLPRWLRPAIGGIATGVLGCLLPQIMDGQYAMIRSALDGSLFSGPIGGARSPATWAALLAAIVLAKCVATAFTVGSGGAGGVLGPSLFIGGTVGAFLGWALQALFPLAVDEGLRQSLVPVGMACVLAASMRTPIAAIVMVMEMTGSFGLIVPLMVATMASYVVGSRYGLVAEQVESAADSPAHTGDAVVNVLERLRVADVVQAVWPATATRRTPLARMVAVLPEGESPTVAVLEGDRLVGLVPFATLLHLVDRSQLPAVVIADDIMTRNFESLEPEESLYDALGVFERSGSDAVPVVQSRTEPVFLGMLTRARVRDLVFEHVGHMRDRLLREHAGLAAIEEQTQLVHLLSGMPAPDAGRVDRVPVDEELADRSLRELDFRARRGGVVLAVQTRDHRLECPPDPGRPLRRGEHLVVLTPGAPSHAAAVPAAPADADDARDDAASA